MKVVITGGSGLIGMELGRRLSGGDHEVVLLSRHPDAMKGLPTGVKGVKWDASTAEGWGQHAEGADAIINLAGENLAEGRWSGERKRAIMESRLNAGRAVVEAVSKAQQKPKVVIQASAVGYYGPHGQEEVTEEIGSGNDFPARVCVKWEESTRPVGEMGVRQTVIRTGIVLSRTGGAMPRMELPFKLFVGGPTGSGKQGFPWIHIDDEVSAILWLVERGGPGPYNLTGPPGNTNAEFTRALGRAIGRPTILPTPPFALKALYGEMSEMLLTGVRAVPKRLLAEGFEFRFPTVDKALGDLFK